jgi:Dynamin family
MKFSQQIGKYIDSKEKKRGFNKDKNKEKEYLEKEKKKEGEPALWPLIRLVQVHCPSEALGKGVILVDLPGVADANAARNSIAKEYMKKCECIWIAAPITRFELFAPVSFAD